MRGRSDLIKIVFKADREKNEKERGNQCPHLSYWLEFHYLSRNLGFNT